MTTIDELETLFDDHPSLNASLQDFEHPGSSVSALSPRMPLSPTGLYPSQHSGFRSSDLSDSDDESLGGYSPPAWRRTGTGRSSGFWKTGDDVMSPRSREVTMDSEDEAEDLLERASRTRLPTGSMSPEKGRSPSPDPYPNGGRDFARNFGGDTMVKVKEEPKDDDAPLPAEQAPNFIRFAMRAEVQHRTEPIEACLEFIRSWWKAVTKTWSSIFTSAAVVFFAMSMMRSLFTPGTPQPSPDLVKVAGLARAFEPLIFYSENGAVHIADLQATGVAVWDLGESVRSTNMTSAPIIVKALDDLSDGLKTLSEELTRFFANVDGDVDGILIVMDWARRELSHLDSNPPTPIATLYSNLYNGLAAAGVLEDKSTGLPTTLGKVTTSLFGQSNPQRNRATLQRTFTEFLSVLEESIENELTFSAHLFGLFESIDRQFLNLARSVIRETEQQERLENDVLASLWTRALGANADKLRKYEKNRQLLANVRSKTTMNKSILMDHNGKLMQLKANLEMLRRKLVSPLVRSDNSSTLTIEEQIKGLDDTYDYLTLVREKQKSKLMELLYGAGRRRATITTNDGAYEIDGRSY